MTIKSLSVVRREAEIGAISEAIFRTGSQARAAIALGISYAQIRRIIKQHDIKLTVNELTANIRKQQKLKPLTAEQFYSQKLAPDSEINEFMSYVIDSHGVRCRIFDFAEAYAAAGGEFRQDSGVEHSQIGRGQPARTR